MAKEPLTRSWAGVIVAHHSSKTIEPAYQIVREEHYLTSQPVERRNVSTTGSAPVPVGTLPPLGEVPSHMHVQVVRQDRFGDPMGVFQSEVVETPTLAPDKVLIAVMVADGARRRGVRKRLGSCGSRRSRGSTCVDP